MIKDKRVRFYIFFLHPIRSSFMCFTSCFIRCCNCSWDIPQIQLFLCSFSFCPSSSAIFCTYFLSISFSYFALFQIILCINHNYFVTFFYLLHNTASPSLFTSLCFLWYLCCLVIVLHIV